MKTSAGIKMESSYSSLSHKMSDIYTITFTHFTSNILIQTHFYGYHIHVNDMP